MSPGQAEAFPACWPHTRDYAPDQLKPFAQHIRLYERKLDLSCLTGATPKQAGFIDCVLLQNLELELGGDLELHTGGLKLRYSH